MLYRGVSEALFHAPGCQWSSLGQICYNLQPRQAGYRGLLQRRLLKICSYLYCVGYRVLDPLNEMYREPGHVEDVDRGQIPFYGHWIRRQGWSFRGCFCLDHRGVVPNLLALFFSLMFIFGCMDPV